MVWVQACRLWPVCRPALAWVLGLWIGRVSHSQESSVTSVPFYCTESVRVGCSSLQRDSKKFSPIASVLPHRLRQVTSCAGLRPFSCPRCCIVYSGPDIKNEKEGARIELFWELGLAGRVGSEAGDGFCPVLLFQDAVVTQSGHPSMSLLVFSYKDINHAYATWVAQTDGPIAVVRRDHSWH